MSSMDHTPEQKERIKTLLLLIAGYEETLRLSIADEDREFQKVLENSKREVYQKLKRVMYGLPEEEPARVRAATQS